jgi:hypothetical protein
MAFKIKDLMINILSSEPNVRGGVPFCTPVSEETAVLRCNNLTFPWACGPHTYGCTFFTLHCTPASDPTFPFGGSPLSVAALATLKEQLKRQLAEIEKQQAAAEENLLPKTVEEVDMLTKKLNDALDELKGRRAELSRKSKPAKNK